MISAERKAWLDGLDVGHKVIIEPSAGQAFVARIDRLTPTQFIVGPRRYARSTGKQIGAGVYTFNGFRSYTKEEAAKIVARNARFRLQHPEPNQFRNLTDKEAVDLRRTIVEICRKANERAKEE